MYGYDANGYYGITNDDDVELIDLVVKRVSTTMFYTVTHKVQIWTGKVCFIESKETNYPMNDKEMNAWIRRVILDYRDRLSSDGVDIRTEYKKYGGDVNDLYMC